MSSNSISARRLTLSGMSFKRKHQLAVCKASRGGANILPEGGSASKLLDVKFAAK
jgi:hypothetical protein